jgi:hypothetical protein
VNFRFFLPLFGLLPQSNISQRHFRIASFAKFLTLNPITLISAFPKRYPTFKQDQRRLALNRIYVEFLNHQVLTTAFFSATGPLCAISLRQPEDIALLPPQLQNFSLLIANHVIYPSLLAKQSFLLAQSKGHPLVPLIRSPFTLLMPIPSFSHRFLKASLFHLLRKVHGLS